jgi:adenosylmethionine-8-amino-7-oxononanoate aminotransferase
LDIFQNDNVIEKNKRLSQVMAEVIAPFNDHPHVSDVRQHGMVAAIEMVQDKATKTPFPWQERRGIRVFEYALSQEALLRPLGNVLYFMPPYVITEEQIRWLGKIALEGIDRAVS